VKTPFTIAINGDWGSGKTSLMKTVGRKINSSAKAKCMVVWFNAWRYEKSRQPLWSSFLNIVLSEISSAVGSKNKERFKRLAVKVATVSAEALLSRASGLGPAESNS
jgi:predicted KAP-like P-loop ATPase